MTQCRRLAPLVAALACSLTGCWAVYATRPVDVVVTHADSGEPAAGVPIEFSCYTMLCLNVPPKAAGTTDVDGRVTLLLADFGGGGTLRAGAGDTTFSVGVDAVRRGDVLYYKASAHNYRPTPYRVQLVARRRWMLQHWLGPRGDEYGKRTAP